MSEQINKVLASTAQSFSTGEQKQARDNIGAMAASASSLFYSMSNPSAFISGVEHDSNLSGNGRTTPLGLNTSITLAKNGESATLAYDHLTLANSDNDPIISAANGDIYMSGHAGNASSPYTANYGLQGMHVYGTDTYNHITATATLRYSGGTFVEGDDSAKIKATGLTLHTTADGDQLVDASSVVRWNSYSSLSGFTGCSANNCISGDGTSSSPLGLSSRIFFTDGTASSDFGPKGASMSATPYTSTYYRVSAWNIHSTGNDTHSREVAANCSGIGLDWDSNYYHMDIHASGIETFDGWYPSRNHASYTHTGAQQSAYDGQTSIWNESSLMFKHSASGDWRTVDISSIDRWNSYSANQAGWNESANSLSTGFGGNQATAASQFNDGAGNWACRRVKCQGVPDQDLYGFQARPNGTGTAYMVNPAGAFIQYQPTYFCYLYHKTGSVYDDLDTSFYPTGLTANARLDFVNLCSAASANIKTDTFHGNTAIMNPGDSATMWYIATADIWTDGINNVPV